MKKHWGVRLLALLLAAGVIAYGAMGRGKTESGISQNQQAISVNVTMVKQIPKENRQTFTGTVDAYETALISPKVDGRVEKLLVDNGRAVKAGQIMVELDSSDYDNNLAISRSLQQKANTALANLSANYDRSLQLFRSGALSKQDLEDQQATLDMAKADADSAAAALAIAEDAVGNTRIRSPIAGVVADRTADLGQVLEAGTTLMAVHDLSSVYVKINVPQREISEIKPGLKAAITVDAYPGKVFDGVVADINPNADPSARVFRSRIRLPNPEGCLKPGMFAQTSITTGKAVHVLAVPSDTLTGTADRYYVFVPVGSRIRSQAVEVGAIIGSMVEIKSGLQAGQKIVASNVNKLKDGDRIKVAGEQGE